MSEVKVYYNDRLIANPEKYFGVPVSASERNRGYVRRFPRRKAKRNRRQAVSFNTRVRSFEHFVKLIVWMWKYGLKITFLGFLLYIAIWACNNEKPEVMPKVEAQAEWVDTYPKVIGLLDKPETPQDIVRAKSNAMFGESEWNALNTLIDNESGWHLQAVNKTSGACGLFQRYKCPFTKEQLNDVNLIADNGLEYIKERYGTPSEALYFWNVTSIKKIGRHYY